MDGRERTIKAKPRRAETSTSSRPLRDVDDNFARHTTRPRWFNSCVKGAFKECFVGFGDTLYAPMCAYACGDAADGRETQLIHN